MQPNAVLITGAAIRVGRELAQHFGRANWDVCVHYNSSIVAAEDLKKELGGLGARCELVRADLRDPNSFHLLIDRFFKLFPNGSVLINNAGVFNSDTVETLTYSHWEENFQLNAKAPIFLAKLFSQSVELEGCVINILDQKVSALNVTPDLFSYTLSKLTLANATKLLAQSLWPKTRVNAIAPGILMRSGNQTEAEFRATHNENPLKRGATAEEICAAADFIVNTKTMTGQIIAIDGGVHLAPNAV